MTKLYGYSGYPLVRRATAALLSPPLADHLLSIRALLNNELTATACQVLCGFVWMGSIQGTSSGFSAGSMSRLTTIGS